MLLRPTLSFTSSRANEVFVRDKSKF